MNIHKLNGFIYVTSEEEIKVGEYCVNTETNNIDISKNGMEGYNVKYFGWRKIILTNDSYLANVQQLTPEEEAYCKTVDSVEDEFSHKNKHGFFEKKASYKLQLPKQETIEEVAKDYALKSFIPMRNSEGEILTIPPNQTVPCGFRKHEKIAIKHFTEGYNEAVKTLYTEEEVRLMLSESFKASHEGYYTSADKIINQFNQNKKK